MSIESDENIFDEFLSKVDRSNWNSTSDRFATEQVEVRRFHFRRFSPRQLWKLNKEEKISMNFSTRNHFFDEEFSISFQNFFEKKFFFNIYRFDFIFFFFVLFYHIDKIDLCQSSSNLSIRRSKFDEKDFLLLIDFIWKCRRFELFKTTVFSSDFRMKFTFLSTSIRIELNEKSSLEFVWLNV